MAFPGEAWHLTLGNLFGIPIALHCTFFVVLVCQIFLALGQHHISIYTWSTFLLYGPIFALSILTHGLSQALRIKLSGGQCQGILLWPLGGVPTYEPTNDNVLEDLWVALTGISSFIPHIFLCIIIVFAVAPSGVDFLITKPAEIETLDDSESRDWISALARRGIIMNLILMLCNASIPAYPLDASRGLASILVYMGKTTPTTASIVGGAGVIVGAALIIYTTIIIEFVDNNPDFMFIFIIIFILVSSGILLYMKHAGLANQHPLFTRECYQIADDAALSTGAAKSPTRSRARALTDDDLSYDLEVGSKQTSGNVIGDDAQLLSAAFTMPAVQNGDWELRTPVNEKRRKLSSQTWAEAPQLGSLPFGSNEPSTNTKPSPLNATGSPKKNAAKMTSQPEQPFVDDSTKKATHQTGHESGKTVNNPSHPAPRKPVESIPLRTDSTKRTEKGGTTIHNPAHPKEPRSDEAANERPADEPSKREKPLKREGSIKKSSSKKSSHERPAITNLPPLIDSSPSTNGSPNTPPKNLSKNPDKKPSSRQSTIPQSPCQTRRSSEWRPLQFPATLTSPQKVDFASPRSRSQTLTHKKSPLLPVSGHNQAGHSKEQKAQANPTQMNGNNLGSKPTTSMSPTKEKRPRQKENHHPSGEKPSHQHSLPHPPSLADSSSFNTPVRLQNPEQSLSKSPSKRSSPCKSTDQRTPHRGKKETLKTPRTPGGKKPSQEPRLQKSLSLTRTPKAQPKSPSTPRRPSLLQSPKKHADNKPLEPPLLHKSPSLTRASKAGLQPPTTPRHPTPMRQTSDLLPVSGHNLDSLQNKMEPVSLMRTPPSQKRQQLDARYVSEVRGRVSPSDRSMHRRTQGVPSPRVSYSSPSQASRDMTPIKSRHAVVFPDLYKYKDGTARQESKSTPVQSPSPRRRSNSASTFRGNDSKDRFSNSWQSPSGRRASPNVAPHVAEMRSPQRVSWSPSFSSAVGSPTSPTSAVKSPLSPSTASKGLSMSPTRNKPPSPKHRRTSLYGANSVRRSVSPGSALDSSLIWGKLDGKLDGSSGTLSSLTCDFSTPKRKPRPAAKRSQGMPDEPPLSESPRISPGKKRHETDHRKNSRSSSGSNTSQTKSSTTIAPTSDATNE